MYLARTIDGQCVFVLGSQDAPRNFALTLCGKTAFVLPSEPPAPSVPVNLTLPVIDNPSPGLGYTLNASSGTWTGSPSLLSYQWLRSGGTIAGATSSSYVVTTDDVGQTLSVQVIASNDVGDSSPARSAETDPVVTVPTNSVPPNIISNTGNLDIPLPGDNLQIQSYGTWSDPHFGFFQQWYGTSSGLIAGATATDYTVQTGNIGEQLYCAVVCNNAAGSSDPVNTNSSGSVIAPMLKRKNLTPKLKRTWKKSSS